MSSLEVSDEMAKAVQKAPRVSLADIEAAISERYDLNAGAVITTRYTPAVTIFERGHPLTVLSICILVLKNGFTVIGKSAPAAVENFDAEVGKKFAYEDAVRQIWPLMGFNLREKLWDAEQNMAQGK